MDPCIVRGTGTRPFYASFDKAASALVGALQPKSLGGTLL